MSAHNDRIAVAVAISCNDVADRIGQRPKPKTREFVAEMARPFSFAKRRRRNSSETNLIGLDLRFVIRDVMKSLLDAPIRKDSIDAVAH